MQFILLTWSMDTKMKIRILSDLHLEMCGLTYLHFGKPADVCILAGDIYTYANASANGLPKLLDQIVEEHDHVIMIEGNHEFYGGCIDNKILRDDIIFLDKGIVDIEGIKIAGCTLWSDISGSTHRERQCLNDFHVIADFKDDWQYYQDLFVEHLQFLESANADVVVTHHSPSILAIPKIYKGSNLNCFFHTDIDFNKFVKQPQVWFHGHTHISCDYHIRDIRIIANPRGYETYSGRENQYFDSDYIIEV